MNGNRKNLYKWLLLCVPVIVLLIIFVPRYFKHEPTKNGGPDQIRIGYSRLRISLPIYVAIERGIFRNHGIDPQPEMYDTAQPMMQALVEGKIDVAGYTAMPITYSGMARSGKKLYFITTLIEDQAHPISYLLRPKTPPGKQPSLKTISDLRGKRIGILPTTAYKAWLEVILRKNGIDPDKEVTIQQIAPEQEGETLKNGGVDALFTNDPPATAAIRAGIAELMTDTVLTAKYIRDPFPFGSFNVSKEWADQHPDVFKRLVEALNEAVDFVNKNPKEAKQAMVPYLPEKFRPDVDLYPDAKYLLTSESSEGLYQSLSEEYLQMHIISQPVSLQGLVITSQ